MNINFDPKADALFIWFNPELKSTRTEEYSEDILLDYSENNLISIEVLNVSKKLPAGIPNDVTLKINNTPVISTTN